jgi:hypothetical protein
MVPATDSRIVPPASHHLEVEANILHTWAIQRGASRRQARRIVGLLNRKWMLKFPIPPQTWRTLGKPQFRWYCYLFRGHCKHILNWTYRRAESDPSKFGEDVNFLIWHTLFPNTEATHGEDEGRSAGGGLATSAATAAKYGVVASPSTAYSREPAAENGSRGRGECSKQQRADRCGAAAAPRHGELATFSS